MYKMFEDIGLTYDDFLTGKSIIYNDQKYQKHHYHSNK